MVINTVMQPRTGAVGRNNMSSPFFISGTEVVLDFGNDFNAIDPLVAYGYFLSRIIFAPEHMLSITSAESDEGTIDLARLKQFIGKSRDLAELANAWTEDLIETEIFRRLPAEWAVISAKLPVQFGKSSFVRFSCGDINSDLSVVAYCLNGTDEEFAESMQHLFSAHGFRLRGGIKSGCSPISVDESFIEEMDLEIDPATHLHPEDI